MCSGFSPPRNRPSARRGACGLASNTHYRKGIEMITQHDWLDSLLKAKRNGRRIRGWRPGWILMIGAMMWVSTAVCGNSPFSEWRVIARIVAQGLGVRSVLGVGQQAGRRGEGRH